MYIYVGINLKTGILYYLSLPYIQGESVKMLQKCYKFISPKQTILKKNV